jgi:outer membrane protein TolC
VALTYQWAFGNNAAEGALAQRAAAYEQSVINYNSLVRTVSLAVEATFSGLIRNAWQLKASTESVAIYRLSLENEKTKNRLGTSTILNVLTVNDSLRNARLAQVSNHLNYLTSLATLGYEMGVLIGEAAGENTVDLARLFDLSWAAGVAR